MNKVLVHWTLLFIRLLHNVSSTLPRLTEDGHGMGGQSDPVEVVDRKIVVRPTTKISISNRNYKSCADSGCYCCRGGAVVVVVVQVVWGLHLITETDTLNTEWRTTRDLRKFHLSLPPLF